MVSHKNYNLGANESFVTFFTSKLTTCFIDCFISKRQFQSFAHLLNESEHICKWSALKMSYMDKRPSRMQELGQAWGGRGSGFSVLPLPAHPDECNVCQGYLERTFITAQLRSLNWSVLVWVVRWSLTPMSVGML